MKIASVLVLASFIATAAGAATTPVTLAKVNDEAVTGADVLAEFVKLHGGHAKFLGGEVEARAFLDKVIDRKLLIQEAYRLGLDQQEDVRKAIDEFEETKAVEYLLRTEIDEKAVPSDVEIKRAWETNTSLVYEMRLIEAPTREEAAAAYLEVLEGKSFEDVARACSTGSSRIYGGKLPLVGWGSLDPSVEAVAFSLEPGDTAPPVRSASGWAVVKMEEIHPVERPEFDKAKMRIEGILKKRKLDERRKAYSEYLVAKYHASPTPLGRSLPSLADALQNTPGAPVETWDGGALTVRNFVSKKELEGLSRLPESRGEDHLAQLLQKTVNDALTRREAKERGIAKTPEIADEVTRRRETLMEGVLYADYVLKDLTVTDDEARADFFKHAADWTTPERRRVAHILVKTRDEAVAAKK
ncbi:MAG TPA: peptidyl-prolyl cis-trans isomerase, partial [Thermoanaerobaculia bacterium]|nr:peptidyl-prolyl cis-trans isomerase [Thermoanaerobaculia bacterium]